MDLTTRTARKRIKLGNTLQWQRIATGRGLGYRRRSSDAPGRWYARVRVGDTGSGSPYKLKMLGVADDLANVEADGDKILTFAHAVERAVSWDPYAEEDTPEELTTVADVCAAYLGWAKDHRRSWREMKYTVDTHIVPELGDLPVEKLTTRRLQTWHATVANKRARTRSPKEGKQRYRKRATTGEEKRARRATANRVLTVLKAALNRAFENDQLSCSDLAWRRVKPFKGVAHSRARYLETGEVKRLLNAIDEEDFRNLVHAATLTGCRYAELGRLRVGDVHIEQAALQIRQAKSGKPRSVFLSREGVALFESLVAGRPAANLVFTVGGRPWGKSAQQHRMRAACDAANVEPAITFHGLRHTYASHYLMNGGGLPDLAEQLGHATTQMVERHYGHLADKWRAARARQFAPQIGVKPARNVQQIEGRKRPPRKAEVRGVDRVV